MGSGCDRCLVPGVRANGITSIGGKAIAKAGHCKTHEVIDLTLAST